MIFLVVDDDPAILRGMVRRLEAMTFAEPSMVLCAESGEAAAEILSRERVDIMLTDIRMQRMDGLSLIEAAKAIRPHLHSIVISAYDLFPYAQKALRLGVDDFLLKPCSAGVMREVVQKAVAALSGERASRAERLSMRLYASLQEGWTGDADTLRALLEEHTGMPVPASLRVACWHEGGMPPVPRGWYFSLAGHAVMLLDGAAEAPATAVNAPAGMSEAGEWALLPALWGQATDALTHGWYWESPRVIAYRAPMPTPEEIVRLQKELTASLAAWANLLDAQVWHAADAIAARPNAPHLMRLLLQICGEALRQACRNADLPVPTPPSFVECMGWRSAVFLFLQACREARGRYDRQHREDPIAWAKRYVAEHVLEAIDMASLAERLHMSYAHFSKRFKEGAGKSFTDYQMQVRMQWAADEMQKGRRVSEVAEALGYLNLQNFSRAFRNFYGMPPKQWQRTRRPPPPS